ncbi:MAG: hypothetical protein E7380_01765 [Clostridiales bacterium]|nr:hypothetical protein [Clostridiales bacterium]
MFILYAFIDGEWSAYASFKDSSDFASQVRAATDLQKRAGKTQQIKNAAIVLNAFVLDGNYYDERFGKLVKRALRNFDEVGLCNDIFDALEELLDEGCEKFALAKSETALSQATEGEFSVVI